MPVNETVVDNAIAVAWIGIYLFVLLIFIWFAFKVREKRGGI